MTTKILYLFYFKIFFWNIYVDVERPTVLGGGLVMVEGRSRRQKAGQNLGKIIPKNTIKISIIFIIPLYYTNLKN